MMRFSLPSENSIGATIPDGRRSQALCLVDFPSRLMAYQASDVRRQSAGTFTRSGLRALVAPALLAAAIASV